MVAVNCCCGASGLPYLPAFAAKAGAELELVRIPLARRPAQVPSPGWDVSMDRQTYREPGLSSVAYGVKCKFSTGLSRLGELTESYLAVHCFQFD